MESQTFCLCECVSQAQVCPVPPVLQVIKERRVPEGVKGLKGPLSQDLWAPRASLD